MLSYCHFPGVTCPQPEPWTYFAAFLIIWAMMLSLAGISVEMRREHGQEISLVQGMLIVLSLCSFHPIALAFQFSIWIMFYQTAPLGGSIVTTLFGLYGIWSFWYFSLGDRFWRYATRG